MKKIDKLNKGLEDLLHLVKNVDQADEEYASKEATRLVEEFLGHPLPEPTFMDNVRAIPYIIEDWLFRAKICFYELMNIEYDDEGKRL